jgi:hypothetical protein
MNQTILNIIICVSLVYCLARVFTILENLDTLNSKYLDYETYTEN